MTDSRHRLLTLVVACLVIQTTTGVADAAINAKQRAFFETKIRPLLIKRCYECHSEKAEIKGNLRLDTKMGWMMGGDLGPAIDVEKPEESLLLLAVRYKDEDIAMPPKGKLPENEIRLLEQWVKLGAPDPRDGKLDLPERRVIDVEEGKAFWAFVPPKAQAAPRVKDADWPRDDIDRFVLAALEEQDLRPAIDADRYTLIRRVTLDLHGLPPTPSETDSFVKDPAPTERALAKVIDRLLASPRFGERWGRHWLDVARYAESTGRTRNYGYPMAWRYRDWVINAFNEDKPYDRFLTEQIAGDLLPFQDIKQRDANRVATGFLALGPKDLNERNKTQFKTDNVDEQIDVVSRSVLALTVACARCHDHKFDPVAQKDYYALAGIFGSADILDGYTSRQGGNGRKIEASRLYQLDSGGKEVKVDPNAAKLRKLGEQRNQNDRDRNAVQRKIRIAFEKGNKSEAATYKKELAQVQRERRDIEKRIRSLQGKVKGSGFAGPMAMGVRESDRPGDAVLYLKGEIDRPGKRVPRGFIRVIGPSSHATITDGSGRKELVAWLTDRSNPLTARVMVNRIWHHLFGHGIVRTVDNFGETGERPGNQPLLDHLALQLIGNEWSIKKTIKQIMLSRTYQMSTRYDEANFAKDPDNRLFWRQNLRRLQVEAIRDSVLAIAGELDTTPMQGSLASKASAGEVRNPPNLEAGLGGHRSVYMPVVRSFVPATLDLFDFAEPTMVRGRRNVTTVAPQALFMMNSGFMRKNASIFAKRVLEGGGEKTADRIDYAHRLALGRPARSDERSRALKFLAGYDGERRDAWTVYCQALLASAEFRYVN